MSTDESAMSGSREKAIEIARRCAKAKPKSYYAEPFQPHEWAIDAIMEALGEADKRLDRINSLACYASEENTTAQAWALQEIGKLARMEMAP